MLNTISIQTRLLLLICFMCLAIVIVGGMGVLSIKETIAGIEEVYHGSIDSIESLNIIQKKLNREVIIPLYMFRDDVISSNEAEMHLQSWLADSIQQIELYKKNFATENKYNQKANELQEQLNKLNVSIHGLIEKLRKDDKTAITDFILHELFVLRDPVIKLTDSIIDAHIHETQTDYRLTTSDGHQAINRMIFIIVGIILLAVTLALWVSRSIIKPLIEAVNTIDQVSLGDTSMQIEVSGKDESSRLMKAMKNMIEATSKMTSILGCIANGDLTISAPIRSQQDTFGKGLINMIERLKQIISEIQSEVNVLSNSTQEIVTSVNQVSTGTAETAAAVTETTTTVEELKQTAHISAEKAKDVLSNAEETLKVVKNSEKTLHLTIDEMNQIQEKMRIISESIIKLSEHSLTIGEIINTVNNLAEQSNLLAVNAAIEAAKAGDQGKSFGVVAQEIRTLAEQSKEATVQVRSILNDIQNATSAAVLATEQGSKAVSKGVAQSSQMSESIHTLSTSISRVAQAANQITISSQQQLVGIDQVTVAMTNINEASSQHVEHMRQIETAVSSLNDVAISLRGLVNQYKIAQGNRSDDSIGYKLNSSQHAPHN